MICYLNSLHHLNGRAGVSHEIILTKAVDTWKQHLETPADAEGNFGMLICSKFELNSNNIRYFVRQAQDPGELAIDYEIQRLNGCDIRFFKHVE